MNLEQIDVIIPVYNAEKYIKRTIKSVINQTYKNWNLIIVNDGSIDKSQMICNEFSRKDSRIRLINQQNSGSISARIKGILESTANYIMFLDADDLLEVEIMDKLYHLLKQNDSDIAACSYKRLSKHGLLLSHKKFNSSVKEYIGNEILVDFFTDSNIGASMWGKLYKKELFLRNLNQLKQLPNIFYGEDSLINALILKSTKKVITTNEPLYVYRFGGGSSGMSEKSLDELVILYDWRKKFLKEHLDLKYNFYNLNQVLNVIIFYYHFQKEPFSIEKIASELSTIINDIDLYGKDYYYRDVYKNLTTYDYKKFKSIYKEPLIYRIKNMIVKIF